jgi:hypothetical protein
MDDETRKAMFELMVQYCLQGKEVWNHVKKQVEEGCRAKGGKPANPLYFKRIESEAKLRRMKAFVEEIEAEVEDLVKQTRS